MTSELDVKSKLRGLMNLGTLIWCVVIIFISACMAFAMEDPSMFKTIVMLIIFSFGGILGFFLVQPLIRMFSPDTIYSSSFFGHILAKIFFLIGPQVIGIIAGMFLSSYVVKFIFG